MNDNYYSWMREALAQNRDSDGERVSELIADTVGGRTRAQLAEQQQQQRQEQQQPPPQHQQPPPQHQQRQQSSTGVNVSGRSSIISSYNGVEDVLNAFARRLEQHPQPGEGARRLHQMVQQPFSVKFGTGSAREIELQRAGSSRPPLTPFFKDAEPDILRDSPRLFPVSHSVGTQTHQRLSSSIPPRPHSRQILSPIPPPTPPDSAPHHFHRPPPVASSSPFSTTHRRAHSLSDYPPLYDFSKRPLTHIRHSSSCALDPNFYRRRFINSLLKDVRRVKELESKLEGRREELDEACRRDADELSTIRRERELLVRELEMQSREYEFEQRERSHSTTNKQSPPPRQQPILKQSTSYPSDGSKSGGTGVNRVNFASPICTARELSPSNSSSVPKMAKATNRRNDSNKQRKQGQQCIAHEAEFSAQQQRNAMAQRRAARGGKHANNPVNPSSIFHFVPSRPT